jgi:hypothetical protein
MFNRWFSTLTPRRTVQNPVPNKDVPYKGLNQNVAAHPTYIREQYPSTLNLKGKCQILHHK